MDEFGIEVWLLERCGFRADPAAAAGRERAEHVAERVALQVLSETAHGMTQQALVVSIHANISLKDGIKISERAIRDAILPGMVRRGLLRLTDGPRNAKVYQLGERPAGGKS